MCAEVRGAGGVFLRFTGVQLQQQMTPIMDEVKLGGVRYSTACVSLCLRSLRVKQQQQALPQSASQDAGVQGNSRSSQMLHPAIPDGSAMGPHTAVGLTPQVVPCVCIGCTLTCWLAM